MTEYLAWDHEGRAGQLAELRAAVDGGDLVAAVEHFDTYQRKLVRHMRIEEDILFPLAASLAPSIAPAVAEMRLEHVHLRRSLATTRRALLAGELEAFHRAFAELGLVLLAHEAREERRVYPVLDRVLSPEQRADLAARLAKER